MGGLEWLKYISEFVGMLVIVILFLRYLKESAITVRKQTEGYINTLTEIGQDCHIMSRENQKNYQQQMETLMQQHHDDSRSLNDTLTELTVEVRALNGGRK